MTRGPERFQSRRPDLGTQRVSPECPCRHGEGRQKAPREPRVTHEEELTRESPEDGSSPVTSHSSDT